MWRIFIDSIDAIYILTLIGLAVFGLNNMVSVVLYWLKKDRPNRRRGSELPSDWPRVTVQLPLFNERYTIERLIRAVACFDYPRDRLQVQVLDDSTDDTVEMVRRLVAHQKARGLDVELIQRRDRRGYKAGALAEGLKTATGKLVAIFDADFVPGPDWLKKTVPEFRDPRLGCLQTRWGHLNDQFNALTRAQSLGIDGHFIVEQTARSRNGLFMNFNGTAGIWRKACIEDAGGWQADTLTEDLDLSYRAQLRGWQIDYLPDVVVPAELPAQIEAFKQQQFRWAKGSFQTVKKMVPALLDARISWHRRWLGILHLTGYIVHPLILLTMVLMLPVGILDPHALSWTPWTMLAAFGPPALYLVSASERLPRLSDRLRLLPILTAIGFGLSLNDSLAVLGGLFGKGGGKFLRTPKFNLLDRRGNWADSTYAIPVSAMVWAELGLGLYALCSAGILGARLGWQAMPWLLIYAASNFYIAGLNLSQTLEMNRLHAGAAVSSGD
jgi:cellulose synthase/poly-beta-1,6-N-acetylglucosamine synthase-like glycosyltransferase